MVKKERELSVNVSAKMFDSDSLHRLIDDLKERAKELNCIYEVREILNQIDKPIDQICRSIIEAIPPGWQYSEICKARISLDNDIYESKDFVETEWTQCATIKVGESNVGRLCVIYTEERPMVDEGPFLKEERKLIENIAQQIGLFLFHHKLRKVFEDQDELNSVKKREWEVVIDMLEQTDPKLLIRISRKMINFLCWSGIKEAEELFTPLYNEKKEFLVNENRPYKSENNKNSLNATYQIFDVAGKFLS